MPPKMIQAIAADIVRKAALDALDFGAEMCGAYVGCCFDNWRSEFVRTGTQSMERDETAYSVEKALASLGYTW